MFLHHLPPKTVDDFSSCHRRSDKESLFFFYDYIVTLIADNVNSFAIFFCICVQKSPVQKLHWTKKYPHICGKNTYLEDVL